MYNVVPWLCAIPLAVGGGYVSDVLINRGGNAASALSRTSFYGTKTDRFLCFFSFFAGYSVAFVRKLMQVNAPEQPVGAGLFSI